MIPPASGARKRRQHNGLLSLENNENDTLALENNVSDNVKRKNEEPVIDSEIYNNLNQLALANIGNNNDQLVCQPVAEKSNKSDSEKEDDLCICCTEAKRDTVFLPCGHL